MARAFTKGDRAVFRRRDGVVAIRPASRWRRALPLALDGALLVVPLIFALAFALPVELLPVPPLVLALALWLLFRSRRPAEPRAVVPLRHGDAV